MDGQRVARELVRLAEELVADNTEQNSGNKRVVQRFLDDNRHEVEGDPYAWCRMKLQGPANETVWMNIGVADLEKMLKVLK